MQRFTSCVCILAAALAAIASPAFAAPSYKIPELPRVQVDVAMPVGKGKTINVGAQEDLHAALKSANPGDTLVLAAGATYTGPFVLPKKSGDGWIIIKSSAEAKLPPPGKRIGPEHAAHMPKLVTMHNNEPALRTEGGAHHYRLIGIEFAPTPKVTQASAIVELSNRGEKSEDLPHHVVLDRVYIHGNPQLN